MKLIELEVVVLVDVSGLPKSTRTFRVAATDQEPMILELRPGITAGDILAEADLAHCVLARGHEPENPLSADQELFDLLTDCEKVFAILPTETYEPIDTSEADAFMERLAFGEGEI